MTITTVPPVPYHVNLSTFDTEKTIAARHVSTLINNVSFLLGKNVENIVEAHPRKLQMVQDVTATPALYSTGYDWFYKRSPGVDYVMVGYECAKTTLFSDTEAYDQVVSGVFPTGTSFPVDSDNLNFNSKTNEDQRTSDTNHYAYYGVLDVRNLSTSSLELFRLQVTASNTVASYNYNPGGLAVITMQEVPANLLRISQTEATGSVDSLWATPFRRLVAGTANTEYGFSRILDQTKVARSRMRNHWQLVNHQGSAGVSGSNTMWTCSDTSIVPLTFNTPGEANFDHEWYIRTRNYDGYTGSEVNSYTFAVRYKTLNGTDTCYLDLIHTSEPNGLGATNTITLPPSTTWTTATLSVDLRCDEWSMAREQLVKINFTANVAVGGQVLYVSTLALIENEA